MIYLFDKDEKLFKIVNKPAIKTALQKYTLTSERYVSDRLTVEMKALNADELEKVEYMAIQTIEDAHTFHYFYVAQKTSDNLTSLIGVQSGIEELRKTVVYDKRPQNAFAREVINDLLKDTNWQVRFIGETTPHSTNFYYVSTFDALKKVCEVWDLEMQFFVEMNGNQIGARYIDFKKKIGQAIGKRVVYGHNALQIIQEIERTNIFTALVGRGKGVQVSSAGDIAERSSSENKTTQAMQQSDGYGRKITFEDVVWSTAKGKPVNKPKGQKYLELPAMTKLYGIKNADGSMRPKIGFVEFPEEEDPEILAERTYKTLIDTARPQLTLKTSSVYLRGVKVGDTIRVVRHDKKLDYDTRIFEITFNRLNNQSSDIKLGDRVGESNEAKAQIIADKAIDNFVANEFSNFVQNLPDFLPSADGFNNNWYGAEDPSKKYPGKVIINDIWYKPDSEHEGHKIMLRWTGEVWEEILRTYDSEALRDRIAKEIAQVTAQIEASSAEHDRQVSDIRAQATDAKTLAQQAQQIGTQAKSDAANALTKALQYKSEAIAEAQRLDIAERQATEGKLATAKSQAIAEAKRLDIAERQATEGKLATAKSQAIAEAKRLDIAERQATEGKLATAKSQAVAEANRLIELTKSLLAGQIDGVSTELTQTKENIKLLATRDTVDALTGRVSSAEASLQVQAGEIASRVKTSDFDQAKQRLTTAESSITQLGNRITTEISETKGLIPKEFGGVNLLLNSSFEQTATTTAFVVGGQAYDKSAKNWNTYNGGISNPATSYHAYVGDGAERQSVGVFNESNGQRNWKGFSQNITSRIPQTTDNFMFSVDVFATGAGTKIFGGLYYYDKSGTRKFHAGQFNLIVDSFNKWQRVNVKVPFDKFTCDFGKSVLFYVYGYNFTTNSILYIDKLKLEIGEIATAHSVAPEELQDELINAKTLITQTAQGQEQLSTQLTQAQGKITKAETEIRQLIGDVSSKVSQTEYDSLSGRVTSQQTLIEQNASEINKRLTSTQVEQAITGKGYQTKAQVDSNITGRGYITNSALQPYATTTTMQNLVRETSGSFERQITETKALIPTEIGGRNYFLNSDIEITSGYHNVKIHPDFAEHVKGKSFVVSIEVEGTNITSSDRNRWGISLSARRGDTNDRSWLEVWETKLGDTPKKRIYQAFKHQADFNDYIANMYIQIGGNAKAGRPKLEISTLPTDWSPAPEDTMSEIESVKTTITQTAQGQEQLSTQLTQAQGKITKAETEIRQLIGDVSSKVSQTEYDSLSGRVTSQQTLIEQNASEINKRLTSTQVEQAITGKGYQTKAQVDSNITGRGYITSSALQPYVTSTVLENKVTETAGSFERSITETKALIPTSTSVNLVDGTKDFSGSHFWIDGNWRLDGRTVAGADVLTWQSGNKASPTLTWQVEAGKEYIFSAYVAKETTGTVYFYLYNFGGDDITSTTRRNHHIDDVGTDFKRFTLHFVPTRSGKIRARFAILASDVGGFSVAGYQLLEGRLEQPWSPSVKELSVVTAFNTVKDTVDAHKRVIGDGSAISQAIQSASKFERSIVAGGDIYQAIETAKGLVSRVSSLSDGQNLVYDPTNFSKYKARTSNSTLALTGTSSYKLLRITQTGLSSPKWKGFQVPLHTQSFTAGEKLSYRVNLWVDVLPDDIVGIEIKNGTDKIAVFPIRLTQTGSSQIFTGTVTVSKTTTTTDDYGLHVWIRKNGTVAIGQISIVRGDVPPTSFVDSTSAMQLAAETQMSQLAGSWAVKNLTSAGTVLNQFNLLANGTNRIDGRLTHITGQTLIDNAVIKSAMIDKLKTANFESASVTAAILAANSVTADKLVVDQALFNKLMANEAYLKQLFAKNAFITQVQSVTMSATQISGGVMRALNNAMEIQMNNGQILYYTDQAALKRILSGYPTQFVKFATGTSNGRRVGVTVIGSNRNGTESSNDGGFVGIRAWNGVQDDSIDVVGDTVRLASSAYEDSDGWDINTLPGKLDIDAHRTSDRPSSKLNIGDVYLFRTATNYISLKEILQQFNTNFKHLVNITGRGDVIETWNTIK
ncbi:phage tail spike protein [Streptococcus hillyeri]|uniref:phage tail spike protein n=1 Tax=Streptococcus hillyeri TaxID=2282420 RepID=UPI0034E235CA